MFRPRIGFRAKPDIGRPNSVFVGTINSANTGTPYQSLGSPSLPPMSKNRFLIAHAHVINGAQLIREMVIHGNYLTRYYAAVNNAYSSAIFAGFAPLDGGPSFLMATAGLSNPGFTHVWAVEGLSQPAPFDIQTSFTTADTVRTVDINSKVGGLITAHAYNNVSAAQSCSWTGDQTPSEQYDTNGITSAEIQSANDDAANTITATFAAVSTTAIGLLAASWR